MTKTLTVCAAVITYRRPQVLDQCLQCLLSQTVPPDEIVVVDSSPDRDSQQVCVAYPEVRYVRFSNGKHKMPTSRNLACLYSSSDIVAYLDDDCMVDHDWLEQLLCVYCAFPEVAGVGGRITDARWNYDPALPIGRFDRVGQGTGNFFGDPGDMPRVQYLPGGNMSFKKSWLHQVGGFDPGYVATNHREDPDFCLRVVQSGGELRYSGKAHARHLNARHALRELKPWHEIFLQYSYARNETYFVFKHFFNKDALWRVLIQDTVQRAARYLRVRSRVGLILVPVIIMSKLAGVFFGGYERLTRPSDTRRNHLENAQQSQCHALGQGGVQRDANPPPIGE